MFSAAVEQPTHAPATAPAAQTSRRLEWLDSIRGLAALVVLLGHLSGAFAGPTTEKILLAWCDGRVAVTMFFVLSGFVLARPYIGPRRDPPRRMLWINFYVRRITRIWLPWLAAFWLSWLAWKFAPRDFAVAPAMTDWARQFWSGPLDALAILKQHFYGLHDPARLLIPQDWSLGVELKGSLLIPVFVFLFRRSPWLVAALGVAFAVALPTGYYMTTFAAGVLLAGFAPAIQRFLTRRGAVFRAATLFFALALIETRVGVGDSTFSDRAIWCVGMIGCSLFLALALGSHRMQNFLSAKPLVFLGRISYSLYLVQFIVILCIVPPLVAGLNGLGIQSTAVLFPTIVFAGIAITVAISAILQRWVEQPSIDFGHWLAGRIPF